MSSSLALFLTLAFIALLFWRDIRQKPPVTGALWLPFLWIVIGPGSRFLSQWLGIFGIQVGGITVEDGSPIDAAFYLTIILAGILILCKRQLSLGEFIRNNRWLAIYLFFCLLAVTWSDFPYVSLKRWIKLLGDPVMALLILTEPEPLEALPCLIKRSAYVMLPVSILFIKYFPNLGRFFDQWTGVPMNTGIATNKNQLGFDCWIIGAVLFWQVLQVWQWERGTARRNELMLCIGLLVMDLWVFKLADSMSSLVAFVLGAAVMIFLGFTWVSKQHVGAWLLAGIAACVVAGSVFGFVAGFIHLLGRNETLTGRTDIWQMLWNWQSNPILGTGFESFWLGDRREALQDLYPGLNEAHNGYLETYLNLGAIGVIITVAVLLAVYGKCRRALFQDFEFGRLRLGYLLAFVLYNWTEAAFRLNALPFFMFFIIAIDYPRAREYAPERMPQILPNWPGTLYPQKIGGRMPQ